MSAEPTAITGLSPAALEAAIIEKLQATHVELVDVSGAILLTPVSAASTTPLTRLLRRLRTDV